MRRFVSLRSKLAVFLVASLAASCGGLRASRAPLGGEREVEAERIAKPGAALPAVAAAPALTPEDEAGVEVAEVTAIAPAASAPPAPKEPVLSATPAAFQLRPYAAGQRWTRSYDLELSVRVGPDASMDMRMTSRQEARFEVLSASSGNIDKLQIEYPVYTSKLSVMGAPPQDSPEALAGKRYVVTFAAGKAEVRDAAGAAPPKKELDTVKDDAREPAEIAKALTELAQLTAKGQGDFTLAGAVSLAGGEDEDTKVSRAKGRLRSLSTARSGAKSALIDLSYTLTSALDDDGSLEAQVSGNLVVLDGPARYETVTLQGPVELKSKDADGMQGRGSLKVTTTYKY